MFRMVFHRNKSGEYCIIYRINSEVVDIQVQKKIDENRYLVLPITLNTLNTLKRDYETVNKLVINQLDNMEIIKQTENLKKVICIVDEYFLYGI